VDEMRGVRNEKSRRLSGQVDDQRRSPEWTIASRTTTTSHTDQRELPFMSLFSHLGHPCQQIAETVSIDR